MIAAADRNSAPLSVSQVVKSYGKSVIATRAAFSRWSKLARSLAREDLLHVRRG